MTLDGVKKVYLAGIGGSSMSSLAEILFNRGYSVSGSDMQNSATTERLSSLGIKVYIGHSEDNIKNECPEVIIRTDAVQENNPEIAYALQMGIPVHRRAELLGMILDGYKTPVGVAGTHGKTTTSGMIASIIAASGTDYSAIIGGKVKQLDSSYIIGREDNVCVFESCEYKDSFLSFFPSIAVILNAEYDHADYFKDFDAYIASFKKYLDHARGGAACVNFDSEGAVLASDGYCGELYSYGIENKNARIIAENITFTNGRPEFDIIFDKKFFAHVKLSVFGMHNVYNTLASAGVALACGITDGEAFASSAHSFAGIKRRFEYRMSLNGAEIYDDYAHHPTEITATLSAARKICKGKLTVVFQPHTYSRTAALLDDFASSLENCDEAVIADIYPARETDTLGMSAELLAGKIPKGKYVGGFEKTAEYIKSIAAPDDTVIIMGAGDVNKIIDILSSAE